MEDDRRLVLTELGRALAMRVMRKHRLAECLLISVIGLPWEEVHAEACRWEHVISEQVEKKLVELLDYPVHCPHGNVIPGLAELGVPSRRDGPRRDREPRAGPADGQRRDRTPGTCDNPAHQRTSPK